MAIQIWEERSGKKDQGTQKKEGCLTTTYPFINLKSNTMKNTLQKYTLFKYVRTIGVLFFVIIVLFLYLLTFKL